MGDEKDFKVIDRRAGRGGGESKPSTSESQGDQFVMKDPPSATPSDVDFSTLLLSLATGALISLGVAPDPVTKKTVKNLELAKQNIDILNLLKEKTKGNLTKDESELLESLLTEVRLRFVEASRS